MKWLTVLAAVMLLAGCAQSSDWHVIKSEAGMGYKIGNDEWPAGTWETAGAQPSSPECTWARRADMTNTSESLLDEGTVEHYSTRVAMKSGEFFVSQGCQPWRYLG